jgi:predicted short-subunit dehydrogenase-like oxidoreductase (DUF2520 family)
MNVAILGAGNVATHLSKALIKAGFPIKQIWSRDHNHAVDLALQIAANSIENIKELSENLDVIFIAVADDAIENVANQIPIALNQILIVHTSGSTPLSVLNNISIQIGVLYPIQTFSKTSDLDFSNIPIVIEGNNKDVLNKITTIAHKISHQVKEVNSSDRLILHVAAVFACNFTNYLYSIADDLLQSKNIDFNLIKPLILETAEKAMSNSPASVQTGPAKRNDQITINKHLAVLENQIDNKEIYQLISQHLVKKFE